MNTKIVLLALITIILSSCNKSQFSTNPHLTFESVNKTSLLTGSVLIFNLSFTDQQGEVDTLFIRRESKVCSDTADNGYILLKKDYPTVIPYYPSTKNQKGTISITFGYSSDNGNGSVENLNACVLQMDSTTAKTDTSYFKFCLKDAGGHLSDTVKSPAITFIK